VKYEIGRRFTTSSSNKISPATDVIPDCAVQVKDTWGFVAETKLGLPKNQEFWASDFEQLLKYDDDLSGWWTTTEHIDLHDVIALVPIERAVRFSDKLRDWLNAGSRSFDRKLAIIGFFKKSGIKDFMALMKQTGEISNRDLDERLREAKLVGFDLLIEMYEDRKFIDCMPPLPYILQILWDHLFTEYSAELPRDEETGVVTLEVKLSQITDDLQEYFGFKSGGPRSPGIPPQDWTRKALDALVSFRLAVPNEGGKYTIQYKRSRQDTLRKFGALCHKFSGEALSHNDGQLSLLPDVRRGVGQ
jgi:hypothetical protein